MSRVAIRLALVAMLSLFVSTASAQVPLVPVAGYLSTASGSPVDGAVTIDFRLYDAATAGTLLHEEDGVVLTVDEGWFVVHLGETDTLDLSIFDGTRIYLEMQILGELPMAPRVELETVAYAAYARQAGIVPWSGITGIPAALSDGDDDTTYTGSGPIVLTATTFGLDSTGCSAGEGWIWNGTDWECSPAAGTAYTAGNGIDLAGTEFAIDTAETQARVSGACPPGESIRAIGADGTVTCEVDDDSTTSYTAGNGIDLTGTEFAIDTDETQARVTGTCPAGESIRAIGTDGTVTCEADDGENYTGGLGITIGATAIAIDPTEAQRRLSETCPVGQAIRAINQDGTVECQADTDTDTTYSAGTGLSLTGTTFAIDPTVTQQRVTGTCGAGQKVLGVNQNGSVICGTDIDTDTNTTYSAGTGLGLVGTTFNVNPAVVQSRVTGTCTGNQYLQSISATGAVTCATPIDNDSGGDITAVSASTGLTGGGTTGDVTVSVDFGTTQRRVVGTCPVGQGIRAVDANGNVTCDSGSSRNVTAEMLLRSQMFLTGGGTITWNAGTERLTWNDRIIAIGSLSDASNTTNHMNLNRAPAGTTITGVGLANSTWQADGVYIAPWTGLYYYMAPGTTSQLPNHANWRLVSYPAADGNLPAEYILVAFRNGDPSGGELFVNTDGGIALHPGQTYLTSQGYQPRVTGSCPAGQAIRAIDQNGGVTCEVDDNTDTNTTYSNGAGILLSGTTFSIDQNYVQRRPVRECPHGYATFYADGNVRCRNEVSNWMNSEWPDNLGGGSGDDAWIRYYSEGGENMILHIGLENDADDNLYLTASGPATLYGRTLNHVASDGYNHISAAQFNQIDLQRADSRKFFRFGDQYDISNTCGGTYGGGNHQINMANWDLAGGCGDAHGFAVWNHGGERIDWITFAENDGDDWNVRLGGGIYNWGIADPNANNRGFDIAEFFTLPNADWNFGDIVVMSEQTPGEVNLATGADNEVVIGVISETPGIAMMGDWLQAGARSMNHTQLRADAEHLLALTDAWAPTSEHALAVRPFLERMYTGEAAPIALAGRVGVHVTGENGPIRIGDMITVSEYKPGAGARAIGPAQTIGVAMTAFDGTSAADEGTVTIYVSRQDTRGLDAGIQIGADAETIAELSDALDAERARSEALENELNALRHDFDSLRNLVESTLGN